MSMAFILIKRNIKLFFKDKGMFEGVKILVSMESKSF